MYLMSAWSLKWPLRVSRRNTPMSWGRCVREQECVCVCACVCVCVCVRARARVRAPGRLVKYSWPVPSIAWMGCSLTCSRGVWDSSEAWTAHITQKPCLRGPDAASLLPARQSGHNRCPGARPLATLHLLTP
jgi:hypothetical protein